ncbi:MAG: UbiX family flavin prenyltransferase [SAR324 cluster bacterium]|nr:UbiX family flavin prenyltransferase [SAR324 cluster bacterium]MBF0351108.1 UbiX family flavin prenyltransferase [SAR324 cluster bacterium]
MNRIVIGITGATGVIYGIRILEILRGDPSIETHLILSRPAMQTLAYESTLKPADLYKIADFHYSNEDIGAAIASGSFRVSGMIIAPCSIKTMSAISHSMCDNLITRAADVVLKEKKRLVLMVRETPLHAGHLENMKQLSLLGGIIAPPVPAFYSRPQSIDDLVNHTVGRVLDLFDIEHQLIKRWKDPSSSQT